MVREPGSRTLAPLSPQQLEKRTVCKELGLGALQAHQIAGIDHVEPHLLQPPLKSSHRQECRAREFGRMSEHPHFAHEVGAERQLDNARLYLFYSARRAVAPARTH